MYALRKYATQGVVNELGLPMAIIDSITPAVCASLKSNGYAIVDNIFGKSTALRLRDEIKKLKENSCMHINQTHVYFNNQPVPLTLPKKDIFEAELMLKETQRLAPNCSLLQNDSTLRNELNKQLFSDTKSAPTGTTTTTNSTVTTANITTTTPVLINQAIKLQWNAGRGACFPLHFDTDSSIDGRIITAIWYLNPDWQPEDGGELRLYPWPVESPVDIEPLLDRMILFSSNKMLHRVLPSLKERYCFTIWLSGVGDGNGGGEQQQQLVVTGRQRALARDLLRKHTLTVNEAKTLLGLEEVRKHAIRWVYRDEWAQSIQESHGSVEAAALVSRFRTEVGIIERALGPLIPLLHEKTMIEWF